MAEIVAVDPNHPDPIIIHKAAAILKTGGLVSFPTETVYGLGADATNPAAIAKIYLAKGRPSTNPLIVHCENVERIRRECVADWPPNAEKLAQAFWPGPLTLILPKRQTIPDIATAGLACVGVRIPESIVARELIRATDCPLAAPSANLSNRISPTTAEHVARDLSGRIDLIIDAGSCRAGVESTVLDLTGGTPVVLRPGPISADQISEVLGCPVVSRHGNSEESTAQTSPGQLAVHYAPRKPMTLWRDSRPGVGLLKADAGKIAVLRLGCSADADENPVDSSYDLDSAYVMEINDSKSAEQQLYRLLHQFDRDSGIESIHIILGPFTTGPEWHAVRDRLSRAASVVR